MCDVKNVSSFSDLESLMPKETVGLLAKAYADVRDIDLFPGGLVRKGREIGEGKGIKGKDNNNNNNNNNNSVRFQVLGVRSCPSVLCLFVCL